MRKGNLSRRSLLKRFALLSAAASLPSVFSAPSKAAKASKESMRYQDAPLGERNCANCTQYIAGATDNAAGTCKAVEGAISPDGYCIVWAPLSS